MLAIEHNHDASILLLSRSVHAHVQERFSLFFHDIRAGQCINAGNFYGFRDGNQRSILPGKNYIAIEATSSPRIR